MADDFYKGIDWKRMLGADPVGGAPSTGLSSGDQLLQNPTDHFAKLKQDTNAPTGETAKSAGNAGQQAMTTAEATPCATCDTNQPYSLAFLVKDANGKPCNGMFYTVTFKSGAYPVTPGQTDENGLTERYFSSNPNEEIYLYIGHREKVDGYPTSRETDEEKYDEAPLTHASVALVAEKKVSDAKTQRLWKPWSITKDGEDFTMVKEGLIERQYDNDGANPGNVTVGVGKLIHHGPFVMNQQRLDDVLNQLKSEKKPVTIENLKGAIGPATGLTGKDLANAKSEMDYVNGIPQSQAEDYFRNTTYPDHRENIAKVVYVPLYQWEFDALSDVAYNRGKYIIDNEKNKKNGKPYNPGGSYAKFLNRGRYYFTGNDRVRNLARAPAVAGRRDQEADIFLKNTYPNQEVSAKPSNGKNQPPWKDIELDN